MAIRNDKGQFVSANAAIAADLNGFIDDWTNWAKQALRNGNREDAQRCMTEVRDCRQKLAALTA